MLTDPAWAAGGPRGMVPGLECHYGEAIFLIALKSRGQIRGEPEEWRAGAKTWGTGSKPIE